MPTEAFMKLDHDRKKKILDAAKQEFSNYNYEDASINRIIKSIDMPRGTFYLYFENKDDLYDYIFIDYKEKLDKFMIDSLKNNDGNVFEMFKDVFKKIVDNSSDDISALIKNFFININNRRSNSFFPDCHKKKRMEFINECNNISSNVYDIEVVLEMVMPMFFHDIAYILINGNDEKVMENFFKKLSIIENGMKKEGNK